MTGLKKYHVYAWFEVEAEEVCQAEAKIRDKGAMAIHRVNVAPEEPKRYLTTKATERVK